MENKSTDQAPATEKNMSNEIDTQGDSQARSRDLEPKSKAKEIDRDTDNAAKLGVAVGGGAVLGSILANID
ncbi:MAG: hypothetical protein EOP05_09265 [Proteobacteria bacterium]|nr:MAG: hypothetical protein EOP05_09265 [Pseudomonadota bacterium]